MEIGCAGIDDLAAVNVETMAAGDELGDFSPSTVVGHTDRHYRP